MEGLHTLQKSLLKRVKPGFTGKKYSGSFIGNSKKYLILNRMRKWRDFNYSTSNLTGNTKLANHGVKNILVHLSAIKKK